jgi:hypothetical protein
LIDEPLRLGEGVLVHQAALEGAPDRRGREPEHPRDLGDLVLPGLQELAIVGRDPDLLDLDAFLGDNEPVRAVGPLELVVEVGLEPRVCHFGELAGMLRDDARPGTIAEK